MAHKQIAPLKGQLAQVESWLSKLAILEQRAPKAAAGAPFPVVMRATATEDVIADAKYLLGRASSRLQDGITFFEESDRQLAELATRGDEAKSEIEALNAKVAEQEKAIVGHAAAAMTALTAAVVCFPKIEEGVPTYRD